MQRSATLLAGNNSAIHLIDVSYAARVTRWVRFGVRLNIVMGAACLVYAMSRLGDPRPSNTDPIIDATLSMLWASLFLGSAFAISRYSILGSFIAMVTCWVFAERMSHFIIEIVFLIFVCAALTVPTCLALLLGQKEARAIRSLRRSLSNRMQLAPLQHWREPRALLFLLLSLACPVLFVLAPFSLPYNVQDTGVSILLLAIAPFLFGRARRHAALRSDDLRRQHPDKPIVYLRAFGDDTLTFPGFLRDLRGNVSLEQDLVRALSYHGPVIAIGRPGERLPPFGAAREYVPHDAWQDRVNEYLAEAQAIVFVIGKTAGLEWEIRTIVDRGLLDKLTVVIPPVAQSEILERWRVFVETCGQFSIVPEELIRSRALLVRMAAGEVVLVTSRARKDGDYFEAIRAVFPAEPPLSR